MITLALQARGATLEWQLLKDAPPQLTIHDPGEADWLHLLIGETAHAAFLRGVKQAPDWNSSLALQLRRLAFGHWLRAWWPASVIDGVPPLNLILLDAEIAHLTDELDEVMAYSPDGEILLDEQALLTLSHPLVAREDLALVAGEHTAPSSTAVLSGTSSYAWRGVPAGRFDASEDAVAWVLEVINHPELAIAAQLLPGARVDGTAVHVSAGPVEVSGVLDALGTTHLTLPLNPAAAWALTPADIHVRIGVDVAENKEDRASIRALTVQRLTGAPDHNGTLYQAEQELVLERW